MITDIEFMGHFAPVKLWEESEIGCCDYGGIIDVFSEALISILDGGYYRVYTDGKPYADEENDVAVIDRLAKGNWLNVYIGEDNKWYAELGASILGDDAVPVFPVYKRRKISKSKRFRILNRDGFKCFYCGTKPVNYPLHIDHKVPVAKGGTNSEDNLVTSCMECNIGKGTNDLTNVSIKESK